MRRPCVLDASVLFAFGKAGELDVLRKATGFAWQITPIVRAELQSPEIRGPVEQLLLESVVATIELDSSDKRAMGLWAEWSEVTDAGEAESIALGLARDWPVALEDRYAQRRLDRKVGRGHWINSADILIDAVGAQTLSLQDAEEVFARLDVYSGYRARGITALSQLLGVEKGH